MKGIFKEIYIYFSNIKKLDEKEYNQLVELYDADVVHAVIDYMIDMDYNNVNKFDYYIDKMIGYDDKLTGKSSIDIYMSDIGRTTRLSREENILYSSEAYELVLKIRELFKEIDIVYVKQNLLMFNSIVDECQFYLENCKNVSLLVQLRELYERFVEVRNILVHGNIRVVVAAARRYFRNKDSYVDIIQCGNMGLMKAVEKYDPTFNTLFISYAYYWIRQSVRNAAKYELGNAQSFSYNAIEKHNMKLKIINMLTNEYGRTPTEVEIATHMGISEQRLAELEDAFQDSISLTAPIFNADGEASNTLMEVFEDRKVDVERDVYAKLLHTELMEIIDKYLTDMQKFIILNRFGFEEEKLSLQKIGDMYGVSKQYIEQTQKKALSKIRRVAGPRLKDFLG